jgi:peptidoglycan/LPS O-acetylase OafA/YrhL
LIGCALGILLSFGSLPEGRWVKIVLRWGSFAAAAGLALIAGFAMDSSPWMCCLGWSLMSLCSAVLIAQIIISSKTIFHRVLENRLLVYLGTISYGLYLWHRPVIMAVLHYHLPRLEHVIVSTTIFTALTLASYYLLELPCLRLKKRFQKAD